MKQIDPTVTPLRPAGGSELTLPAGRPSYLSRLRVTSGETNLDCQTLTVFSLAKLSPGWLHASSVIMSQFSATILVSAILLLSTVTQPATNSHALLGDPDDHTSPNQAAVIDTARVMECYTTRQPDNLQQQTRHMERSVLIQIPITQVKPYQVTEFLTMFYVPNTFNLNKHMTHILVLGATIHATLSNKLTPLHRTFVWSLYIIDTINADQSNKIKMFD